MTVREFAKTSIKAEDAAFQRGDFTTLSRLEHPGVVYHMGVPIGDIVGHEAHKNDIMGSRQACGDIKQEWKYLAGDGNVFAMGYKATGPFVAEKPASRRRSVGALPTTTFSCSAGRTR